jgi:ribonucleotide reductase alpha subunit
MKVIKRDGIKQEVSFDKVKSRIKYLCDGLDSIDPIIIAQQVIARIYDNVHTSQLDELTAEICATMSTENYEYGKLAGRIIISNNHKNTSPSFSETVYILYNNKDIHDNHMPLVSHDLYNVVMQNKTKLNDVIDYKRDYSFDYFGFKTLEKAYLFKMDGKIIERIQHLLLRVSLGLHVDDLKSAIESYNYMSTKYFIHATPTLFHSGTLHPQLLSCYLLGMEDSVTGIYKNISDCSQISKWAGGIGIHISNTRSKDSIIRGTNGRTNGIIPMLRVYNETARYINQSGKRQGSIAVYLEPHHPEIIDFLQLRKNHGNESERTRDLFLACWVSDLFMQRVENDEEWSLFDPDECPGLCDTYGEEYNKLYLKYEKEERYRKRIKARTVWNAITNSQIETGTPYILFKDTINKKSNQKNVGVIRSSNLCAEIVEYSDDKEYACCTLGSISLPAFTDGDTFNYEKLIHVIKVMVRNLNKIIELNFYPVPETEYSNRRHRPLGLGVQGLADLFAKHGVAFDSGEARILNRTVFETIYYGAMKASCELAEEREGGIKMYKDVLDAAIDECNLKNVTNKYSAETYKLITSLNGSEYKNKLIALHEKLRPVEGELDRDVYLGSYSTFIGSPLHSGQMQFDLWDVTPTTEHDWEGLRQKVARYGVRNSLLTALMPTASTSQILGNNECFEPYTSNMYTRRTIAGDFIIVNKYLIEECCKRGIWNKELKDKIMVYNGSIQHIDEIPDDIKSIYKTVWEIKQKHIIQLAADRGPYICQTQSMNLFFEEPTNKTLSSALFYGWKAGLKTGSYYIRSQPRVQAQQFTVDPRVKKKSTTSINTEFKMNINPNMSNISHVKGEVSKREQCARDNQEACDYCSG